jgi:hypothetical protein
MEKVRYIFCYFFLVSYKEAKTLDQGTENSPLGVTEKRLRGAGGAAGLFAPCRSQHLGAASVGAAGSKPAAPAGPGALASGLPCLGACALARLFWGHFRTRNTLINHKSSILQWLRPL